MTELEVLIQISEKLDKVADRLEMVVFIGVFALFIHYSEKWFKMAMTAVKEGGK